MRASPPLTRHAAERWAYRCFGLDPDHEWAHARRITAKGLARLKHHSGYRRNRCPGVRYLLSPAGCVFVVGRNGAVITVMRVAT